jgi:hypothetical protein
MNINQRLQKLERTEQAAAPVGIVVIFDPATGQPLAPVDLRATVQLWLPDNGRGSR